MTKKDETPQALRQQATELRAQADELLTTAQRLWDRAAQMELSAAEAANYARSHAEPPVTAKTEE